MRIKTFLLVLLGCCSFIVNAQITVDIQTTPAACAGAGAVEVSINGLNQNSTGIQLDLEDTVNTIFRSHSGVLSNTSTYIHTFSTLDAGTYTLTVSEQMSGGNISSTQTTFTVLTEDNSIIVDKVMQSEGCDGTSITVFLEKGTAVEYYVRLVDPLTNNPATTILSGITSPTFEIDEAYIGKLVRVYAINPCGEEGVLDFTVQRYSGQYFLIGYTPKVLSCSEMSVTADFFHSSRNVPDSKYPIILTVSADYSDHTISPTTYSQTITSGNAFTPHNIPFGDATIIYTMEDACGKIVSETDNYRVRGYNLDTRFYKASNCNEIEAKIIVQYGYHDLPASFFPVEVLLEVSYEDPNEPTYSETYTINSNQEFKNYRKIPAKNHIGVIAKPKVTIKDACGNNTVLNSRDLDSQPYMNVQTNSCLQE